MNNEKLIDFFRSDKKYSIIILICFLYAGFSLITFMLLFSTNAISSPNERSMDVNDLNMLVKGPGNRQNPISTLFILNFLVGGVVSLIAGLTILSIVFKKSKKEMTYKITNNLLLPNEQNLFNILSKYPQGLTQSKLTLESGLNKVQVHRIIKKLEDKNLIEKHKYGATNKLFLK